MFETGHSKDAFNERQTDMLQLLTKHLLNTPTSLTCASIICPLLIMQPQPASAVIFESPIASKSANKSSFQPLGFI